MNSKIYIAIFYLIYGIIKVIVGLSLFIFPKHILLKHFTFFKYFVSEQEDDTLAGHLYEYVLFAFGIFTIFNAFAILHVLPPDLIRLFETKYTEYTVFILFGLILTSFYSLVIFTNLPIPKSKDYSYYTLYGFISGIIFLLMPVCSELMLYFIPTFHNLSIENKSITIMSILILLFVFINSVYFTVKKYNIPLPKKYSHNLNKLHTFQKKFIN